MKNHQPHNRFSRMKDSFSELDYQSLLESYSNVKKMRKISQIANSISNLPSNELLKKFCKTEDLQFFWWRLRCFYEQIARCFAILFLQNNIEDCKLTSKEFFKQALNQKWINKRDIMLYELEAERLLKEWSLIESGFPYLIAELENFQFYEDTTLFCALLQPQVTQSIEKRASIYYEVTILKRAQVFEEIYQVEWGSIKEKNKVLSNPLVLRDPLKENIINFLWQKSLSDRLVKKRLEDLQTIHNDLALTASESCNTRNSNGKRLKSEVWKNGERYLCIRQGLKRAPYLEELKLQIPESSLQEVKLFLQQQSQSI